MKRFIWPLLALTLLSTSPLFAIQKTKAPAVAPVFLTRTATRREVRRFAYGGTVTVIGAPKGSITLEGWPRSEVEVIAEIELKAETEADLDRLAAVNNFSFDEDTNHISILTIGTHDRSYMKRAAKNFPKNLLNLPWKIDYRIKVPAITDVELNAGHGPVNVSAIEGALRLSAIESETILTLGGGVVSATITAGNVRFVVPVRSWRGGGADIRIAAGVLNVELPPGFNGDIDADILRTGKIVDNFGGLEMRQKPGITERVVRARAGAGGAFFKFTVGDGTLNFVKSAG
ncbi:MAG TPA: hypothetical protein VLA93_06985 [Pyrinomonadaceae bacterium]|nr:hypothetical protein [Pyrinomonadaceae bacterium]